MGLFDIFKPKKYSEKWIRSLSDKDFYAEREPVRKALCNGSEKAYDILDRFDKEEVKRLNKKYDKEHKGKKSDYRWTDKNRWE